MLNIGDPRQKYVLHYIFCPRINRAVESFIVSWNHHPVRTMGNRSPELIWCNGIIDQRNARVSHIAEIVNPSEDSIDDLHWYGFDPYAPSPTDDGLSTVELDDAENILTADQFLQLQTVDPLKESSQYGIDIFMEACQMISII